jgi:lipopolysaccharide transport system ATP-binding protein
MDKAIAIKVENISKVFPLRQPQDDENGNLVYEHWALKDVSFEIKKGESVGIIGPNGSGKSTLLKILAGVIKPTTGKVIIKGKVASILDIGAGFHPELSGRENVFLNGQIHGFSKKEIISKFDEIVAFSGIEKFIDEPVKNYSNGMYLRLAFSIMVHLDFDVYLFDEVFSVGDAEFVMKTKTKFQELLQSDKTMVFVSHNINELNDQDKYILLEKGETKNKTYDKHILSEYLENVLIEKGIKVHTKTVFISDFSSFPTSNEIKLISVGLSQEGESFRTDKAFTFEVKYEKTNEDNTLDIMIVVCDSQGIPILSSSPIITGSFSEDIEKGIYIYTCTIPPYFFSSKVYRIDMIFLKNSMKIINNFKNQDSNIKTVSLRDDVKNFKLYLSGLIAFKPLYINGDIYIDMNNLNLKGNILPAFNWACKNK